MAIPTEDEYADFQRQIELQNASGDPEPTGMIFLNEISIKILVFGQNFHFLRKNLILNENFCIFH